MLVTSRRKAQTSTIRPGNPCGLRGCLEAYTGGAALAARIREDIARGQRTAILDLAGGETEAIDAEHWCDAIRAGDAYARDLRTEFLGHLAHALAILILVLDPERIVLGTIIRPNPDLFLEELRSRVRGRIWPQLASTLVVPAELGDLQPAYAGLCVAALEPDGSPAL